MTASACADGPGSAAPVDAGSAGDPREAEGPDVADADPGEADADAAGDPGDACVPEPVLDPSASYPARATPPDVLGEGERRVAGPEDWWCRLRPHALRTLSDFVYGEVPPVPDALVTRVSEHEQLEGGELRWEQLELRPEGTALVLHVAVFLPSGGGPHPVFVGQNPCGNASLTTDEQVRATDAFRLPTCGAERGGQAGRYPIASIVARGYAFATWHESEVSPDDVRFAGTIGALAEPSFAGRGAGVLAAWAWGAASVVRAIAARPDIDPARVAVFGHSRRGKVALLVGAIEPAVSLVVSHQSGTAGATLSRSDLGESVEAITTFFPHWFGPVFASFAGREDELPFDQHWLIALSAPRPVLVTNGEDDEWADPPGSLEAVRLADPVWELLGSAGLIEDAEGVPTLQGPLAWHTRPGGHSMGEEDWRTFLDFADARASGARQ